MALFVAQVMRMICSQTRLRREEFVRCVFFAILMGPSKYMFLPLLLMVFLIPGQRLGSYVPEEWAKKLLIVAAGVLSAVGIMAIVNVVTAESAIHTMMVDNASVHYLGRNLEEGYTITWVLSHIGSFLLMCLRTIIGNQDFYFFSMMGESLGWLTVYIPLFLITIFFIFYLMAVNIRDDRSERTRIGMGWKGWIALLCVGSVLITMLAMLLDWTEVSMDTIDGVQGRYFLPLLIPGIWLFKNKLVQVESNARKYLVFGTAALDLWVITYIFAYYTVMKV